MKRPVRKAFNADSIALDQKKYDAAITRVEQLEARVKELEEILQQAHDELSNVALTMMHQTRRLKDQSLRLEMFDDIIQLVRTNPEDHRDNRAATMVAQSGVTERIRNVLNPRVFRDIT